jgi:3-mercaptopyruvate sulfurtransferase SseA
MDLVGAVTGLPKWVRLALAGVAGALLIWGGWTLWLRAHDKQHDAQQAAQVTKAELEAERTAEANDAVRQQERQSQTKDLNDARDAAPAGADAGPKTRAVLGKLREQQAKGQ